MNAPVVQPSPIDKFRQEVLPPEKAADLWRALPAHIKPAVFERNLVNALMANPSLLEFHPSLVYREVCKAAGLGLLLDPILGEAYIVTAWNGKTRRVEPQLRVGYKGMCKLARQAGDVTNIYAHEVCQKDKIVCHMGTDKQLIHEPNVFQDRGPVIGYYAVIKFSDGTFDFEPMTVAQCQAIRDRSDAWKAFKEDKIKSTPWQTDEGEMSKKTTLRRLMKRQPQSPELAEAIRIEDEAEFPTMREAPAIAMEAGPKLSAVKAEAAKIEHKPQPPMEQVQTPQREMELVTAGRDGQQVIENENPAPSIAPAADEFANWRKDAEGALSGCTDSATLFEVRKSVIFPAKDKVSAADWQAVDNVYRQTFDRIALDA